jgi:uncharacterized protein DUF4184
MPFTVSHIAAVLPAYRPLARARLFTAAVIGSMVPDLAIVLPGNFSRQQTHSFMGLLTFSLPAGLMFYWLTLLLFRPAVLELLPDGVYTRLRSTVPPSIRQWRSWLNAAVVLLLGACTHLIWDGFTHENARGVRMIPLLSDQVPEVSGHSLPLYRLLQHGSSVGGLLVVAVALLLWWRHSPAPSRPPERRMALLERLAWVGAYAVPPVLVVIWWMLRGHWLPNYNPFHNSTALAYVAMRGLKAAANTLLAVSVLILVRLAVFRRVVPTT